jgi:GntR family transcriptional regulator
MQADMPLPKYHQIYLVLKEGLLEGKFAQGMPGEISLVQQFGVARVTVRKALELLSSEGLITRQRGRGTVVKAGGAVPDPQWPTLARGAVDARVCSTTW